jgi:hypothetical protein
MDHTGAKVIKVLLGIVAVAFVLLVAYTWFVLTWSYSTGDRIGYVQKLSKKGWLCKTWEGEMALVSMPGTVAEKFYFTVRDEKVVEEINRTVGSRVALTYAQHVGIPSNCFGDTQYFISSVRIVEEPVPPGLSKPMPKN